MMRFVGTLFSLALAALAGLVASACTAADKNIVETAVGAGQFKTLAAALTAGDLVDALQGEGPFTVFAPTDEAFAKLPEGTLETLLKPENKVKLVGILTYHVVPGKVVASQVVDLNGAKTLNGQRLDIAVDGSVKVDSATVTATDIECSNGVIHVIDSVLLPADKNIPETAVAAGTFKTLVAAVGAAGLGETLSGDGPFTVFAPTDDAFAKLPAGTVESLLKPENKQKLVDILTYHVVSGRVYSEDALKLKTATTVEGSPLTVSLKEGGAFINAAKLVTTDIDASNGVIHVIDSVLLPPEKTAKATRIIEEAVSKGAHLYNSGHHAACAQLYHDVMSDLMDSNVSASLKSHMSSVITSASHQTCPTDRAWTLRRGMDRMYSILIKQ